MGIHSLAFFLKTWIHLWNLSGTNFFASSSDFATSSSLFQISHSAIIFCTSSFFGCFFFFFSFFFFPSLSSLFFSSSSFFSSFFYFCYPDFPCFGLHCFPYSSRHLIIFISPVFQSISGLW